MKRKISAGTLEQKDKLLYPNIWEVQKAKSQVYIHNYDVKNTFTFRSPDYLGVAPISDMHFGASGVNYLQAESDAKNVRKTKGAKAVIGGDGIDNHIRIISAMINSDTSIKAQIQLLEYYLNMFGDNILAIISGNHDRWSKQVSGVDWFAGICKDRKIMYNADQFFIKAVVGKVTYLIKIRHKFRMNSMMNLTHSVKQMLRFGEDMFDVGIIGHHHEAAAEFFDFHGEKKLAIRTGSYKIRDTYGRQEGYNNAAPVFPFFILHPGRKDYTVFPSVEAGCDYLRFLRKGK